MGVRRAPLDALSKADLVQIDDATFWDKTRPPDIAERDTDTVLTITATTRSDLLAFREAQSSNLGWTIMHRNDMRLWPNDMVPGTDIAVPSRESLSARGIVNL